MQVEETPGRDGCDGALEPISDDYASTYLCPVQFLTGFIMPVYTWVILLNDHDFWEF